MDDSPERTIMALAQAQSPITQDSPFFNYLNNLSPINLVKSAHVAQTFSELNFPPPPAVFTSPRVSCSKESSFMKRPSQRDIEDKEIKMPGMESDKVNNSDMNMSSSNTVNPLDHAGKEIAFDSSPGEKTIGEDKGVGTFSGCSPSQYLSDPADEQNNGDTTSKVNADSLFPLEMMQQHSSQDAALCNTIKRMDLDSDSKTSEEFALSSYEVTETDGSIQIVPESISFLDGTEQINAEQAISKDFGATSSGIDSDGNAPNFNNKDKSLKASSAHAQDFVSQKVSSFASVLSKDSACNPSAWQNVSSVEHSGALIQQGLKDLKNQYEVTSQSNDIDTTPQPLHDSFQDQHGCSDIPRKVDNEQTRPTEHQASFACKPCGQIQRGAVRRRCLDFEATESQNKLMSRSLKSLNAPSSGSTSVTSCMPSRIGLHLNSLASTMSMNPVPSILASGKGPVSVQGLLPLTRSKENPSDVVGSSQPPVSSGGTLLAGSNPTGSSGMMLSLLEKGRGDQQEMQPSATQISVSKTTNSMRSLSVGVKPIQGRLPLKPEEGNLSPQGKKRPLSQDFSRQASVSASDEASQGSQGSPRKKRKSAAGGDKEGCKRCHCKKSKCLKLYCECFAAGVYCVEPCTCHDCHNKPEYEDLVLSTRQQIESRNPLAFAPKIICDTDSPPNTGDEVGETPSTARHKKGCNCKKSLCNKKYCECFQAGVACSDGCRCEGCMNGFGKKEGGYDDTGEKAHPEAGERESSEEKVELHDSATDNLSLDQQHANDLTPITPSVQSLSQGRSMVKTKPSVKKPSVSEDVESSASQSCAKPPKSPGRALRPIKGQQKNSVLGTFSQLGSRCSAPSIFTPKMEKSDQVCPKWDGSSDISSVTPMLHHPLPLRAGSADGKEASLTSGQKTDIPCLRVRSLAPLHNSNGNTSPLFQNPTLRTPLCLTDSNRWQSPMSGHVTPSTPSLTRLGYNAASKSSGGSGDVDMPPVESSATAEDDTPEILKTTCSPPRVFKASSPNQKRVSPPHGCFGKEMNREFLSSSPGLRSGRKIILQSVSSFPPLTPVANEDQGKD